MNASTLIYDKGDIIEKTRTILRERLLFGTNLKVGRENPVRNKFLVTVARSPRYFNRPACKFNRKKKRKTQIKKRKPCYICTDSGHNGKFCPQVNECSACTKKERENNEEEYHTSIICLKCGSPGHDMFFCTNDYDPEDLKSIQCYICKDFGHLRCTENNDEGPSEASCYNCGQSGHSGFECMKLNEAADDRQLESICSRCQRRVHSPQATKLDNKLISGEFNTVVKDAASDKSVKRKAQKARRRERKRQRTLIMPTSNIIQSLPTMSTRGYSMPRNEQYNGQPGSNVWLSRPAATTRNWLNNSPALNQPSYGEPGMNVWFAPPTAASRNFIGYSPAVNQPSYQTGVHFPQHDTNYREATHVPSNPFHPYNHLPREIFHQGTQVSGPPQNRVQFPHQNFTHQMRTHVPESTFDSGMRIFQQPQLPHHVYNNRITVLLPHQKLQRQLPRHPLWNAPEWKPNP